MSVGHGAVKFRFSPRLDTFDAQYRLDGGSATPWRVNIMTLAANGLSLGTDDPRNPSGGVVTLPLKVLGDVRKVWIRPRSHGSAAVFQIDRLRLVLTVAERQGCGADIFGTDAG